MTETAEEDIAVGNGHPTEPPAQGPDGSLLDQLRERREEIRKTGRTLTLEIPGYQGLLLCRYKQLSWLELRKIAEKVESGKDPRRELLAAADTLARACVEFLVDDNGTRQPLHEVHGVDEPIRYDDRLAGQFGYEATTAREVVLGLFPTELAVTRHHNDLAEWMGGASTEDDEEFLGESRGAARSATQASPAP